MIPQPIDQVPLFQKLSHEEREVLTGRFRHYTYEPNNVIFSAGKPSELLGVVVSGLVKLESESPNGPLVLVNLGAGSVLGEVDCLLKRPASTTARAGSPLDLLVLSRADLEDILIQHPTIGLKFSAALGTRIAYLDEYLATQRLAVLPLFSGLSEESLYAMASRLEFRIFGRGESLFENGSDGEFLFLIESGRVRVVAETAQGEEFSEWHEGDLLGQQAIVTGKPYGATAFALSDLQSWVLSRTAYIELIKNHPAIKLAFSRALSEKLDADEQGRAVAQLGNLALFSDLEATVLASLANHLVLRHYPAGEWIYTRGTPGDAIYFVDSGEIRLYPDSDLERYLERKTIGTSFGEMALLTGRTRTEAARAQTDTTLWVLYKADYDNLLVQHPTLSLALTRALSADSGVVLAEAPSRRTVLDHSSTPDLSRSVSQRGFLRLVDKGVAYTTEAPTMWDVDFKTAVAQAELEDRTIPGAYHRLVFTRADGAPLHIETTRPELLAACVAVVAHPDDVGRSAHSAGGGRSSRGRVHRRTHCRRTSSVGSRRRCARRSSCSSRSTGG